MCQFIPVDEDGDVDRAGEKYRSEQDDADAKRDKIPHAAKALPGDRAPRARKCEAEHNDENDPEPDEIARCPRAGADEVENREIKRDENNDLPRKPPLLPG